MGRRFDRIRNWGLVARAATLGLVVALLYAIVLPVAWYATGPVGILTALTAAAICLLGAVSALIISEKLSGPRQPSRTLFFSCVAGGRGRQDVPRYALRLRPQSDSILASGTRGTPTSRAPSAEVPEIWRACPS